MTKTKRSSDDRRDRLLCPVTSQRDTKDTLRRWTGWVEGQSGSKVTKVPIDENKIRRRGMEGWGVVVGSREMRVFVFKEEIGWPGIFLAYVITVVSVTAIAQKYKGPLLG